MIKNYTCPCCGKLFRSRILVKDLVMCTGCTHIFKTAHFPAKGYENYRSSAHVKRSEQHIINAKLAVNFRFAVLNKFAKPNTTVLEIGCGHRYFLDKLNENGYKPEGTELSKAIIQDLALDYKIHYGSPTEIKDLPKFDNICGFHVLEHLNNPEQELTYLVERLADDGVIVLEFPCLNFNTLEIPIQDIYEDAHTQYFNQMSMMHLFDRCKLVPIYQTNFWDSETRGATLICLVKKQNNKNHTTYMNKVFELMCANNEQPKRLPEL